MIINIKQILDHVCESLDTPKDFIAGIELLLEAVSLNFEVSNLKEDSTKLWIKDCEEKNLNWKRKMNRNVAIWNVSKFLLII